MLKIKDRSTLALVSGLIGATSYTITDSISHSVGISKRSYREAAAGMFVSRREARTSGGAVLGLIMSAGVGIIGASVMVSHMTKTSRDNLLVKGVVSGIGVGAIATVLPGFAPKNKMKPKDAASNLSYVFSNIIYGLLTTFAIAKLGHDSLFDVPPQNDYLKPTEKTSEQRN